MPLHQEPERSLLIAAPKFSNQLETINEIAKSLPENFHSTFPMKDVFAKTACMLLKGVEIESIGKKCESFFSKKDRGRWECQCISVILSREKICCERTF